MKKKLIILISCMLVVATILPVAGHQIKNETNKPRSNSTLIEDVMLPDGTEKIPLYGNIDPLSYRVPYRQSSRGTPEYDFIQEPTSIMTSHYDYMPGSYSSYPLRVQSDGGHYFTFHGQEGSSGCESGPGDTELSRDSG